MGCVVSIYVLQRSTIKDECDTKRNNEAGMGLDKETHNLTECDTAMVLGIAKLTPIVHKVVATISVNFGISYALNSSRHAPSAVSLIVVGTLRVPSL